MIREIGSEFWSIPMTDVDNHFFPKDIKWFLAGRSALKYIIDDSGIKSVMIPRWCCCSMIKPFTEAGVRVFFYEEEPQYGCDAVFLIDYFGYSTSRSIKPNYKGVVIRDVTHSLFSREYDDADYYFGSLRKWAGFWTGGFAWGNWNRSEIIAPCDSQYVELRKNAMEKKAKFIAGEIQSKDYLHIFSTANDYLEKCRICAADPRDIYAAHHIDIDFLMSKKRKNAQLLLKTFDGLFELGDSDCPLFVPIKVENRDALRNTFIEQKIYCPVHWPNMDLDGKELSLVCDQRYDEEDMLRVCEVYREYKKSLGD